MSKKVLICDDEEGIRESLKLIVSEHFDCILVDSGQQCLDCLKNSKDIGLVLLDIKMPKVSGLDLLTAIKQKTPEMPVIMVTGYRMGETINEASMRGASGYIIKPFKSTEIVEAVKKNLG